MSFSVPVDDMTKMNLVYFVCQVPRGKDSICFDKLKPLQLIKRWERGILEAPSCALAFRTSGRNF